MCGNEWTACQASAACVSFRQCEASCGNQQCKCEQTYPTGAALWAALDVCGADVCDPCAFEGIGDPCGQDFDCDGTFTSCSEWCTQECSTGADCMGREFGDQNAFGFSNYCLLNGDNVDSCFPGCSTNADCQAFPGTDCEVANPIDTPTVNVTVCTAPGDAGAN